MFTFCFIIFYSFLQFSLLKIINISLNHYIITALFIYSPLYYNTKFFFYEKKPFLYYYNILNYIFNFISFFIYLSYDYLKCIFIVYL